MTRITVPVEVRWSDLDANGHVNNVAFLTILEEVRIRHLHVFRSRADQARGRASAVVARHEVEYLAPMPWSERPVRVDLWVARIGGASIEVCHQIRSPEGDPETTYARAVSVIVYLDPATQRPRGLRADERAAFAELADEPMTLRGPVAPAALTR
ncbi:acyl-CoA thioesterase [Demequina lignilytica]|uniref:Thioesterase family protein n=1 Tax=Demequina lignilytica TaxID=3051663 RepID=A0AB35MEN5_9MICO|nr:thioesterase family protein [Demequina sp. SYSU T0a273]MDN4482225.1 thioesterase family protein [Demequina sp. SYSU T0a273]